MVKNSLILRMSLILSVVLLSAVQFSSYAQKTLVKVTGVITGDDGEPLIGAAVYAEDNRKGGVVTDLDGGFSITVPKGTMLVFSYLGYDDERQLASPRMAIVLKADKVMLDASVSVGYTKQSMRDVSAAVAKIDMDALENTSSVSLVNMLAGQAAGMQTVIRSGVPGASNSGIVIRGNTSLSSANDITGISNPLYIIDGIPMALQDFAGYNVTDNDFLSTLNPQDVQSIDILKDAAATAIYGSRGANGVVIITTRRGTSGAPRVTARASYGVITKPSKLAVYLGNEEREAKIGMLNTTLSMQLKATDWQ